MEIVNVKDRLIDETANKFGISRDFARSIINHQFVMIKLFMSKNEVGEIHIPRLGYFESHEGRVKYIRKNIEKHIADKK